jgi:hypothetical protein
MMDLEKLVAGIAKLSKGYLPPEIFSPSRLKEIVQSVEDLLRDQHPAYDLALTDFSDYYDMKLVTFGVQPNGEMMITFPILVKHRDRQPITLYEIETVAVPITGQTPRQWTKANMPKPYLAVNELEEEGHYIELRIPELRMCKEIHFVYYCEELFLVKHKSRYSCASALFHDLPAPDVLDNCDFTLLHESDIVPSILDGGDTIVLANMLHEKSLACNSGYKLDLPLPDEDYVMINRSTLCYCTIHTNKALVMQSLGACDLPPGSLTVYHTINMAFCSIFQDYLPDPTILLDPVMDPEEEAPDIHLQLPTPTTHTLPTNLKSMASLLINHTASLKPKGEDDSNKGVQLEAVLLNHRGSKIFQFCMSSLTVLIVIWLIYLAIKYSKLKVWLAGLSLTTMMPKVGSTPVSFPLHPPPTETPLIENGIKLVCQDPWVSIVFTMITVLGILLFLYRELKNYSLSKGILYNNRCTIYLFIAHDCYYIPIKITSTMGIVHQFLASSPLEHSNLTLIPACCWDTLSIDWSHTTLYNGNKPVPVPNKLVVSIWQKMMLRNIMGKSFRIYLMVKQGRNWHEVKTHRYSNWGQTASTLQTTERVGSSIEDHTNEHGFIDVTDIEGAEAGGFSMREPTATSSPRTPRMSQARRVLRMSELSEIEEE